VEAQRIPQIRNDRRTHLQPRVHVVLFVRWTLSLEHSKSGSLPVSDRVDLPSSVSNAPVQSSMKIA